LKVKKILIAFSGIAVIAILLSLAKTRDRDMVTLPKAAETVAQSVTPQEKRTMPDTFEMKDVVPRVVQNEGETQNEEIQETEQETDKKQDTGKKQDSGKGKSDPIKIVQTETQVDEEGNKTEAIAYVSDFLWSKSTSSGSSSGGSSSGSSKSSDSSIDSQTEDETQKETQKETQIETQKETQKETKKVEDETQESESETQSQEESQPHQPVGVPKTLDEYNKLSATEVADLSLKFSSAQEYNEYIAGLRSADSVAKGARDGSKDRSLK